MATIDRVCERAWRGAAGLGGLFRGSRADVRDGLVVCFGAWRGAPGALHLTAVQWAQSLPAVGGRRRVPEREP